MLAFFPSVLPPLDFTERWRIVHRQKGWDRGIGATAVVGERILFVEETARNRGAYGSFDLRTGKRLWSRPTALETTSYLSATSRYAVVSGEHRLLAFDSQNGKIVWQGTRQGFGAGPLIVGNRLFAELKPNTLSAIDLPSRRTVWSRRYPVRVQTQTGFDRMKAIGEALWIADAGGEVTRVRLKDGKALGGFRFTGGEVVDFVPTKHGVVVFGTRSSQSWDAGAKRRQWIQPTIASWSGGHYRKGTDQLWTVAPNGRLRRYAAQTGRLLAESLARPEGFGPTFDPVPYRGGLLVLSTGPIVRLDAQARPVGSFDPQESIYGVTAVGEDILLRSENGLVRLRPGSPPLPTDPEATARRLVAQPVLAPGDRRTLLRLGRRALPALFEAVPRATGDRQIVLAGLLSRIAERRDTSRMFALADAAGLFSFSSTAPRLYTGWMLEKADPDEVALALLPRWKDAHDDESLTTLALFSLRSIASPVVDELLARLRSSTSSDDLKGLIYSGIAASGRADVLDEILRLRGEGRRLEHPNPSLSSAKDSDGDGLMDDVDANPLVAPRELDETQRVLFALFDARFRFDARTDRVGLVDYGEGVPPFELVGWRGGLVPRNRAASLGLKADPKADARSFPYPFLRFSGRDEKAIVVFDAGRTEAKATVGVTYGGLDGTGFEATLKKMRGEWFVVSLRMTWIS